MSKVDELKNRIISMIDQGCTRFGWTVGSAWHSLPIEEKARAILEVWDAPTVAGPPVGSGKEPVDLRDFAARLAKAAERP